MASVVVCALLFRWVLPLLLLGASCIRINGFSFIYLCCLLIIPLLPNPTRKNFGPCGHTGNLQKAILGLSVIAIVAQITFQIVLAAIPPYGHFLPNCSTYEQLAREIGLNRFDAVPAYTVVRYILPDVVVFITSLSCVLCCKRLASSPVSRAATPKSPQKVLAVSHEPTTTDNIMPYVMAAMLLAAGIIQPSVISVIYFVTFLGLGTVWACHKAVRLRHRKAFACIRLILMIYSGLHVLVLYLYQSQFFQDVLPPQRLITRLLGLVGIVYTDCNHPQVLHVKQNIDWPLVSCPGVILLLYWLLATETRIYFTTTDSSPLPPNQAISWWNPSTWPQKASSERQSLIAGAEENRNYNAITQIPEDGVPEEPVQPVLHETRDTEENLDVQGTLGSIMMFLMRQSYIAA
ncbi:piezo-type mechanosensitive ion channel component 2-like, partial [Actinia tenebrosa]|uniref:Piezo-type mechanosensitive ion channel component 2-like n=1 Tax=Actinia tenebrosa TaxID=6105 RepID=A0A6P8IR92_ACTTE